MDQKYDFDGWSSRWDEDRIGFHVAKPNPFLLQYWHHLDEIKPKRCLVPLCGKSLDLVWLSEKVETVIGVELVEKAVLDFFREQQIIPEIQKNFPFNAYSHQRLKILQGNFFDLNLEVEDSFQAVFDRASLVAIPEELRPDYVQGLTDLMISGSRLLLICVDYDPSKMSGPPYSVSQNEVENLFSKKGTLEVLETRNDLEDRMRERGLEWLNETVYLFEKN